MEREDGEGEKGWQGLRVGGKSGGWTGRKGTGWVRWQWGGWQWGGGDGQGGNRKMETWRGAKGRGEEGGRRWGDSLADMNAWVDIGYRVELQAD